MAAMEAERIFFPRSPTGIVSSNPVFSFSGCSLSVFSFPSAPFVSWYPVKTFLPWQWEHLHMCVACRRTEMQNLNRFAGIHFTANYSYFLRHNSLSAFMSTPLNLSLMFFCMSTIPLFFVVPLITVSYERFEEKQQQNGGCLSVPCRESTHKLPRS